LRSRNPRKAYNSFITIPSLFLLFYVLFLILCMFCLCDRVDDMPFEGNQEQQFEEEQQQFVKEGKWTSPPVYSILSQ